jgi:hypothetical protein
MTAIRSDSLPSSNTGCTVLQTMFKKHTKTFIMLEGTRQTFTRLSGSLQSRVTLNVNI